MNSCISRVLLILMRTGSDRRENGIVAIPDQCRPDVIRVSRRRMLLFIGDAKNSETPGNRETQRRLFAYFRWIAAFLHRKGSAVFVVGFVHRADTAGWVNTTLMLNNELSMAMPYYDVSVFPGDVTLVRFVWLTDACRAVSDGAPWA